MSNEVNKNLSWEEAINIIRNNPDYNDLVLKAYLLPDVFTNAKNFYNSEEWQETLAITKRYCKSSEKILDIGAGNGIASYSFAKSGYKVVALEPDNSETLGTKAIQKLSDNFNLNIEISSSCGENIPYDDNYFDFIYTRQTLHHSDDLTNMLKEIYRVLKPKGYFFAVREHVITKKEDLKLFLNAHPVHKYSQSEHAYLLSEYIDAFMQSNFKVAKVYQFADTVINYFPLSTTDWNKKTQDYYKKKYGSFTGTLISKTVLGKKFFNHSYNRTNNSPGRLYSFLARKV